MMFARTFVSSVVLASVAGASQGALFLNGALAYNSNGLGQNVGGAFEYDTFGNTGNSQMIVNNLGPNISIAITLGANDFTWANAAVGSGLGLYIGTVSAPVAGPFGLGPDLVIGAGGFAPAAGVFVPTYGQFSPEVSYSGATSVTDGEIIVTITGYTFNGGGGTFQLTATEVPTPGAAALLAMGALTALRRRR